VPSPNTRCCRTTPRCRSCPLRFAAELRDLQERLNPAAQVPEHLAGVPTCLHKYEPLFRRASSETPLPVSD
jgi:hypothetical protein